MGEMEKTENWRKKVFLEEWFGFLEGRELGKISRGLFERVFATNPRDMFSLIEESVRLRRLALMSVQPYKAKDRPYAIEKLFFDFDSEGDLDRAWCDVVKFADALIRFYGVRPLIVFSGGKGYHVYVFLNRLYSFEAEKIEIAKQIYLQLQKILLRGLELRSLDTHVLGDIKRLSRLPFSLNEKSGNLCLPIDLNRRFYLPCSLFGFQTFGLSEDFVKKACEEVKEKTLLKPLHRVNILRGQSESIRPIVRELIEECREGRDLTHRERLIILLEMLKAGCSDQEIHDVFRNQPDYDEKKTQYFIEHARKRRYKPFTREKILEVVGSRAK